MGPFVKLNITDFAPFVLENNLVITEFYVDGEPFHELLEPEFAMASAQIRNMSVPFARVNCREEQELCEKQGVIWHPTIKVYRNHRYLNAPVYRGKQNAESIVEYVREFGLSSVITVRSPEELNDYTQDNSLPVVVNSGVRGLNESFYEAAEELTDEFLMIRYLDPLLHESSEQDEIDGSSSAAAVDEKGTLQIYLPHSDDIVNFDEDVDQFLAENRSLTQWLRVEILPLFTDATPELFRAYMATKLPAAYYFYTSPQELEEYTPFFTELAGRYRGYLNFIALNSKTYDNHVKFLGMKPQFPLFGIHNVSNNMKYGLPQLSSQDYAKRDSPAMLKTQDILSLVENFMQGTASPIALSEDPVDNSGNLVKRFVGSNHDDMVRNKDKDVVVKYYAPWCIHSKRFAPLFEEIAEIFNGDPDASNKIVFAEVDSIANDILSFPVEGYPTIVIYPAGHEGEPIVFEGTRNMESLFWFIHTYGHHHLDGASILESKKVTDSSPDENSEVSMEV